jgi:hypothetical protein
MTSTARSPSQSRRPPQLNVTMPGRGPEAEEHEWSLSCCRTYVQLLMSASASAAVITTAPAVTYSLAAWNLTVTPEGATDLTVTAGESFTLEGQWTIVYTDSGGCPTCSGHLYPAGIEPSVGQVEFAGFGWSDNYQAGVTSFSGAYSQEFAAPLTPGTYYIGTTFDWVDDFQPDRTGVANGSNKVRYEITVDPVPEPSGVLLLASGMLGLLVVRPRFWSSPGTPMISISGVTGRFLPSSARTSWGRWLTQFYKSVAAVTLVAASVLVTAANPEVSSAVERRQHTWLFLSEPVRECSGLRQVLICY